ncbi:EAL domain-containing protein [Hyphomicrobium sp. CS1GBMeth3]|uniref:EAL domain-containing protein n=1 Tax=Hyphomicrobium sp. CS1GBMeth3 TaxID=1892845 RepID=UPI000930F77D|nr:EAL domain-containing protein [Hyphomicrobium sp. CS1GBMeth3]
MTRNQTTSQTVVVVAMGLVAAASAVALHQHAGMPGPVAATAALSAYLLLLTVHTFLWRRERNALKPATAREARASGPALATRTQDVRKAASPMPPPIPAKAPAAGAPPAPPFGTRPNPGLPPMPPHPPQAGPRQGERAQPPTASRQPERAAPPHHERAAPPPLPSGAPPRAAKAPPPQEDLQDLWSFRPAPNANPPAGAPPPAVGQKLPPFVAGRASTPTPPIEPALPGPGAPRGAAPAARPPAPPKSSAPREADVEVIQDAIKRLLEEVNAAEQGRTQGQSSQNTGPAKAGAVPPPLPEPTGAPAHEASIERSIDALRMTAGSMRAAFGGATDVAVPTPQAAPEPPPLPPFVRGASPQQARSAADARARLMADAISAGRIDVSLEPILGLEDQQTRHYEVSVRLRDADGNPLEVSANGPDLRGTGLLPLFDGVRVTRTAAVARRLEERGKGGSVFSAFSGESVADEHFLGELAETLHQRAQLASQLVLSFTQSDVRGFSTPEWDSLADMRALGFRFAITHLTDLDMDFEALAEQGFVFAKLDAAVFLDGLRAPSGFLPSSDVCRHLARHGLTLVVERIDNDEQLARVFGFGVLLGQGQLFGGARPVRADVVNSRTSRGTTVAA